MIEFEKELVRFVSGYLDAGVSAEDYVKAFSQRLLDSIGRQSKANVRFPHEKDIVDKVFGAGNLDGWEYDEAKALVELAKEELLKDIKPKVSEDVETEALRSAGVLLSEHFEDEDDDVIRTTALRCWKGGVIHGADWQRNRLLPMIDNICKGCRIQHEKENPVCEGLEEEIKSFAFSFYQDNGNLPMVVDIARHFAQWGAEHRGSSETSKDLEEASSKFATHTANGVSVEFLHEKLAFQEGAKWQKAQSDKELSEKIASAYQLGLADKEKQTVNEAEKPCHTVEEWMEHIKNADQLTKDIFSKGPYNVLYDALNHPYRDCYDAIKEFGELCYQTAREDMMKEAVEGEVVTTNKYTSVRYLSRYGTFRYFYGIGGGFQKGDKVKLIIVKEDTK